MDVHCADCDPEFLGDLPCNPPLLRPFCHPLHVAASEGLYNLVLRVPKVAEVVVCGCVGNPQLLGNFLRLQALTRELSDGGPPPAAGKLPLLLVRMFLHIEYR